MLTFLYLSLYMCAYQLYIYICTHNYKSIPQNLHFDFHRFAMFAFSSAFESSQYCTSFLHASFPLCSVANPSMAFKIDESSLEDVHITWPCEGLITLLLDINTFLSTLLTSH